MLNKKYVILNNNQKNVLSLIRQYGAISGADITRITGQQRSTMAYILKVLEKRGLIEVSGVGQTTASGGKPPILWRLVKNAGYIIGFDVTPSFVRTTITDFSSTILYQDTHNEHEILADSSVTALAEYIRSRIDALKIKDEDIIGVAVAIPGLVDRRKNMVVYYSKSGIHKMHLQEALRDATGLPINILNDTNAGALGIKWFSTTPKQKNNIIFINYDENHAGIGAGFIFGGSLYSGADGLAGEFMLEAPKLLNLQKDIFTEFPELNIPHYSDLKEILDKAGNHDEGALIIVDRICRMISSELAKLVTLLNPSQIIIGGNLSYGSDRVLAVLNEMTGEICREFYPQGIILPVIRFSPHGAYSISMGATALFVDEIFNTP